MRETWLRVEDLGADVLFTWDHFYPLSGDPDGKHFECWSLLAAMAEATERVEIGALVACNSYRNPDLLADMTRTIDHISGGRMILGIGAGWFERDYDEYGYEFGTAGDRLRHVRRNLPRIKARLPRLNPPPVREHVPILIGGGGERVTLRIVAEHADIWHGFGTPDVVRHKLAVLDEWCRQTGRDPDDIERSVTTRGPDPVPTAKEMIEVGATFLVSSGSGPEYDLRGLAQLVALRDSVNG
jgi:probable F420-dependent oxidoreductase